MKVLGRILGRVLGVAAIFALLAGATGPVGPVFAQNSTPQINLLADGPSKTQEERDAEAARDKAYKESLKKIPDAKVSSDPWGSVRGTDAAKAPPAKATASAKTKPKTGSAN